MVRNICRKRRRDCQRETLFLKTHSGRIKPNLYVVAFSRKNCDFLVQVHFSYQCTVVQTLLSTLQWWKQNCSCSYRTGDSPLYAHVKNVHAFRYLIPMKKIVVQILKQLQSSQLDWRFSYLKNIGIKKTYSSHISEIICWRNIKILSKKRYMWMAHSQKSLKYSPAWKLI